jgi:hypothetical protein
MYHMLQDVHMSGSMCAHGVWDQVYSELVKLKGNICWVARDKLMI